MNPKLKCKNPDCPSNTDGENPYFSVSISVGDDGELCESVLDINGEYFNCNYCDDTAGVS